MIEAFIGLGANIGEPLQQLNQAVAHIANIPSTSVVALSSIYQSAPMGPQDQPDFLNACLKIQTDLSADRLLEALKAIEEDMGRVKARHWGERCIDLDLLLYGATVQHTPHLTLPHPGISERAFVLMPLIDIEGNAFTLPCGASLGSLLACQSGEIPHSLDLQLQAPGLSETCVESHSARSAC